MGSRPGNVSEDATGGPSTPAEPPIRNISDTARWVAVYRARETERPDALFRDPYADRLAGKRGRAIAAAMAVRGRADWPFAIRTYLFDALIAEHVRSGGDMILNLAAGLDTRPYRMDLPGSLRWIEVDLPEILDHKEEVLAAERPRCSLRRVRLDLADRAARRELFTELGSSARNALVITEGLVIYLAPEQATALAEDLAGPAGFRRWLLDLASPGLRRMLTKQIGSQLEKARAPLRFSPEEGTRVFEPQGWYPVEARSYLKWAARKGRVGPVLRLLALLPESRWRQGSRPWAAACLLERRAAG